MGAPFLGSEALAAGVTWTELQNRHRRLLRDVYVTADTEVTAALRAKAGWLWSGKRGIIAGRSAAALHGSRWVDASAPVELFHGNRHRLPGIQVRGDNLEPEEVCVVDGVPVTTPARTALDLACWNSTIPAVAAVDALARATSLNMIEVEPLLNRSAGRRGIVRARRTLALVDPGAQSPKESWLRVTLLESGLPRPRTQIPIRNEFGDAVAYLDMGWEDALVAVEYDGEHHRTVRSQYSYDIRWLEMLQRRGWTVIRVTAADRAEEIVRRVRAALAGRA
ncbi:MAG: hypothetical protein KDB55_19055 [Mycobacterium sp.]|nr:hypothetical protein [Mycobacterium sp.]